MTGAEHPAERPGMAAPAAGGAPGRVVPMVRAALVLLGFAGLVYGVHGALGAHRLSNPFYSLKWAFVAIVLHDAVVIPVVAVIGVLLSRLVPAPYRAVVQVALFVSGSVALISLPLWRGYTSDPGNATVDPLPYDRNLLIVLGAVWFVAVAALVVLRFRTTGSTGPDLSKRPERAGPGT